MNLSVSCVLYNPNIVELQDTLTSLSLSVKYLAQSSDIKLHVVDNSSHPQPIDLDLSQVDVDTRSGHGNIGFGAGHNLAINQIESDYHLILNPDVVLDESALKIAIDYMDANPDVVLLSPESKDPETGLLQYQCKQYPSMLVLALRFLGLSSFQKRYARQMDSYEEKERINKGELFEPDIVSGCFMMFRTDALKALGGFDERFFLYFEDFDLSLRAKKLGRVVYHPEVKIQHYGGGAGRKGWLHIKMFLASAFKFFQKHGWKLI